MTRRSSMIRILENHEQEHWPIRCSHVFESSVLHVSHWWFCSSERRKRKHAIGKPLLDREKQKKEKVLWSVLQSRCQRKFDGTVLGGILFRLTENPIQMNEISEKTWNEELNKLFLVKSQLRENFFLTGYDLEIQNLERRNSEYALVESRRELESQRWQLLEANQWTDQAQRESIHLCSELEMKNRLHQECCARICQEIEELRRRCFQEENGVTRQKLNEYSLQQD